MVWEILPTGSNETHRATLRVGDSNLVTSSVATAPSGGWLQFRLGSLRIPFLERLGEPSGRLGESPGPHQEESYEIGDFFAEKKWMEGGGFFFRNQAGWMDAK